jgi:ubiquitin thioesterase protein OTUB1
VAARRLTVDTLMERMNENPSEDIGSVRISDYVVMFLRMVTSAELARRSEFFTPFIAEEAIDMSFYRQRRVDPMGEEADQLHIIALVDAIGIGCRVEYLDGT